MKKKGTWKQRKKNRIFRYLQIHPIGECKKIAHKNKLLEIKMQELKPEEESSHQNNNI
jgi:hypothetical protein